MTMFTSPTAAVVILAIPAAWTVIVTTVSVAARQGRRVLGDLAEKLVLAAMIFPVLAGCVVLAIPSAASPLGRLPQMPDFVETAMSVANHTLASPAKAGPDLGVLTANALLVLWGIGAAFALFRLLRTHNRLKRIVGSAEPTGDGVYCTDAAVPAFCWSGHTIVVPKPLMDMPAAQLNFVLAHERAHQRRQDPLWFMSLSIFEALFWFNPFIARQGRACRMAAELACDAEVAGTDEMARKSYAQTLIAALKLSSGTPVTCVPAVGDTDGYRLRIGQIMKPVGTPKGAVWLVAALALVVPVTVAQLALAKGTPAPIAALSPTSPPVAPSSRFVIPVEGSVSEGFGIRIHPTPEQNTFHSGIDFVAPTGTSVKASANGKVTFAGEQDGYGTTVEIDHADGMKTRYAHLDSFTVKEGDAVTAGQVIGAVGSSGKSNQPHLHFEIWQNDQPQNPAPFLNLP